MLETKVKSEIGHVIRKERLQGSFRGCFGDCPKMPSGGREGLWDSMRTHTHTQTLSFGQPQRLKEILQYFGVPNQRDLSTVPDAMCASAV